MKKRIVSYMLIGSFLFLASGCQESSSQNNRRAQLVGNENIQLKKQLQEKEQEIERLQGEIKKMEEQAQAEMLKQGETYKKLLDMVADLNKQIEECNAGQAEPATQ